LIIMSAEEPAAKKAKLENGEEKNSGGRPAKFQRGAAVKPYYRIHAHTNPLADKALDYPAKPSLMDWKKVFPAYEGDVLPPVEVVDIGCAWGGLAIALGELLPSQLILGLEIRERVVGYTRKRLAMLQAGYGDHTKITDAGDGDECPSDGTVDFTVLGKPTEQPRAKNVACLLCNCMKNLPNFFVEGSLKKMFFCFPDPQFKKCKQRRRIINPMLLAEYAYCLADGGILYTITDVFGLHEWMAQCCDAHPLFQRLSEEECAQDPCVALMHTATEEAQKVDRNKGKKYAAVYRRIPRKH